MNSDAEQIKLKIAEIHQGIESMNTLINLAKANLEQSYKRLEILNAELELKTVLASSTLIPTP